MIVTQNRREILKYLLSVSSGLIFTPSIGFNFKDSAEWPDDFSINKISNVLDEEEFLETKVKNGQAIGYNGYTIARNKWVKRSEILIAELQKNNFQINVNRNATPAGLSESNEDIWYEQRIEAQVNTFNNSLYNTSDWKYKSLFYDKNGQSTLPWTTASGSGSVTKNGISIKEGNSTKSETLNSQSPVIFKWMLSRFISKLHTDGVDISSPITIIDETDSVIKDVTIEPGREIAFKSDDKIVHYHSYLVKGHSMIPTIFWVSESGQTILYISGMEAYFLNEN